MDVGVKIDGLTAYLAKERTFGAKTEGLLTEALLGVGERVAVDVRNSYEPYSVAGAAGIETKVFTTGLWVVQTLRKSRNVMRRRPNFGPLMYRKAFAPAAAKREPEVLAAATAAVEEARIRYWDE